MRRLSPPAGGDRRDTQSLPVRCLRSIRAAAIGAAWLRSHLASLSAPVVGTLTARRSPRPASNLGRDLESSQRKSTRGRIRAPAATRASAQDRDMQHRQRSPGQDRRYRVRFGQPRACATPRQPL